MDKDNGHYTEHNILHRFNNKIYNIKTMGIIRLYTTIVVIVLLANSCKKETCYDCKQYEATIPFSFVYVKDTVICNDEYVNDYEYLGGKIYKYECKTK